MLRGAATRISRRRMLQLSGMAAAAPALAAATPALGRLPFGTAVADAANAPATPSFQDPGPTFILEVTIADRTWIAPSTP
jgi:hypothetical protein